MQLRREQREGLLQMHERGNTAVFARPGFGKTLLLLSYVAGQMYERTIVVGPKQVIEATWPAEIEQHGFDISHHVYLGKGRVHPVELRHVQLTLMSFESVMYYDKHFGGLRLPWQHLIIDESSLARTPGSKRTRILKRWSQLMQRVDIATGTARPKSLKNLWSQIYMLDGGKALGTTAAAFDQRYMTVDNPHKPHPKPIPLPGAEAEVYRRIAPMVFEAGLDNLKMPELIENTIHVRLPPKARAAYDQMREEKLAELASGKEIIARNDGVAHGKLRQLAAGFLYVDRKRGFEQLHHEKIDAVVRLVEELDARPLMVLVSHRAMTAALRDALPAGTTHETFDGATPDGATAGIIARWNRSEIHVLFLHPASAGHGLNLQTGRCRDICIVEPNPSFDYTEQAIFRVWRSGNIAESVFLHWVVARNTVDTQTIATLRGHGRAMDQLRAGVGV